MPDQEVGGLKVKIDWDSTGFRSGITQLNRQLSQVKDEFAIASAKVGDFGTETDQLRLKSDSLNKQLNLQRQKIEGLQREYQKSAQEKGEDAKATQNLYTQLVKAQKIEAQVEKQLRQTNQQLQQQSTLWGRAGAAIRANMDSIGQSITTAGQSITAMVTLPLAAMGAASVKASVDLETAFTGVRKTVDGTEQELAELKNTFEDMSQRLPVATEKLYGIGEAAGQLGIHKDKIASFTEVMAKLDVTTNLAAEQAANSFARFANITQMSQNDFDRLGSSVVELGNNLATTEAEISEMSLRLAGAGAQIQLTEAQITGFGGALSSVGLEAEAGGSAFSRVMIDMANAVNTNSKELAVFAKTSGMSVEQFRKSFKEDAASAIISFVEGLDRAGKSGQNVFGILESLGLSEIRVRDALLRTAGAGDLLRRSINLSTKAWEENNALNKEAELRFATTASQMQLFLNKLQLMGKQIGDQLVPILLKLLDGTKLLIDGFSNLSERGKTVVIALAAITAGIGPLLLVVGGAISAFAGLTTIAGALGIGVGALAGIIGGVVIAITALVAAGAYLYTHWDEIKAKAAEVWQSIKDTITGFTDPISNAVTGAWESIKNRTAEIWNSITAFFQKWWPLLLVVFTGGLGLIPAYIIGHWEEIKQKTAEIWESIRDFFVKYWDRLKYVFGPVAVLATYVVENWDRIKNSTSLVWEAIRRTVAEKFSQVRELVTTITDAISTIFNNTIGRAWDWGKNLIQNFIDGIKSKIAAFVGVLEDVSNEIKDFLGFSSPTRKGPGRYADKWAPNFMEMFIDGLKDFMPSLRNQVTAMADQLNITGSVDMRQTNFAGIAGAGGPTIIVQVSGNYLANSVDEDRLAAKVSRKIAQDYFNSTGGSF